MEKTQRLKLLHSLYRSVSLQLSFELVKDFPDVTLLKGYRRQLLQIDKGIRDIQNTMYSG